MRYICFKNDVRIKPISTGLTTGRYASSCGKMSLKDATVFLGYKGRLRINQGDKSYLLERGTFYIMFPDTAHSVCVEGEDEQEHFACYFLLPDEYEIVEADNIKDVARAGYCVLPEFSRINDCEKSFVLLSQLFDEFYNISTKENFKTEICDSFTKILLCTLSNAAMHYSGDSSRRVSVEKIFYWLRINAQKGISASDAAKALNYNADYLNQIIKAETGMTLTRYLNAVRIEASKTLLLNSDMPVSQIAYRVGFCDEKYFMKIFKQYENVTPSQYRTSYFQISEE